MRIFFSAALLALLTSTANAQTMPDEATAAAMSEQKAAKPGFGIKAGYNIAKLNGQSADFRPDARNGFFVAGSYSPGARPGLGYRTEIVFSRQGFAFAENGTKTDVTSDYVYMPHFTTFGIGRVVQLHVGGQLGYLLKSSKQPEGGDSKDLTSFSNRLDYGAAGGVEIYPNKHVVIGGRYNVSFGNAYKRMSEQTTGGGSMPSPLPLPLPFNPDEVKGKNAVINFYIGFRF